jgi:hypothetical protein
MKRMPSAGKKRRGRKFMIGQDPVMRKIVRWVNFQPLL